MTEVRRRPLRFYIKVDGRVLGEPFRNSGLAHAYADVLREECPWSYIEVTQGF